MNAICLALALLVTAASADIDISLLSLLRPQSLEVRAPDAVNVSLRAADGRETRRFLLHSGEILGVEAVGAELRLSIPGSPVTEAAAAFILDGRATELTIVLRQPHPWTRRCRGELAISATESVVALVLRAPLEQVVAEVTAAELDAAHAPEEALKAQAVCIRSWLLAERGRRGHTNAHFCDTTHCLLYRGRDGAFGVAGPAGLARGEAAARATAGLVLAGPGGITPAWFHASCGGETVSPESIWGAGANDGSVVGVSCPFCAGDQSSSWQWEIDAGKLAALFFADDGRASDMLTIGIEGDGSIGLGRADRRRVVSRDEFRLTIGRVFGWKRLRSNRWNVESTGGMFRFSGRGSGHGVGLCQAGAIAGARAGWDWRRIVRHYFPRCTITTMPRSQ